MYFWGIIFGRTGVKPPNSGLTWSKNSDRFALFWLISRDDPHLRGECFPVTLTIHGNQYGGEISLVNSPGPVADSSTADHIISALDALKSMPDPA